MAFFIIGLGLSVSSISKRGLEAARSSDIIYLEGYTADFPYSFDELSESLGVKFKVLGRKEVEGEEFLKDAREKNVSLMVYGDVFSATTHFQLVSSCKEMGISCEIIGAESILTAVSRCGLSLYKFGKVASLPDWRVHKNKPKSFSKVVEENLSIGAHSLILADIGLEFRRAIDQLKESLDLSKIGWVIVLSRIGAEGEKISRIDFFKAEDFNFREPYCIVIPGKLSDYEAEFLERLVG